jgi:hypothetical protein
LNSSSSPSGDGGDGSDITLTKVKELPVFNSIKKGVVHINELEFAEGLIFANVWYKDYIIAIDPEVGSVVKHINLSDLYPKVSKSYHITLSKTNASYNYCTIANPNYFPYPILSYSILFQFPKMHAEL